MYFSHRHRHSHLEPSNNELCLICLEDNRAAPFIHFKELYQYPTKCKCNGIYHLHCVNIWISTCNGCPICRSPIIIINNDIHEIDIYFIKIIKFCLILFYFFCPIYTISMLINYIVHYIIFYSTYYN